MLVHRRITRSLALACATAAVAAAPSSALARPAGVAPGHPGSHGSAGAAAEPQTVVREIRTGGDQTLALILSGGALLVALAGAGVTGQSRRRAGRLAQPQV